MTEGPKRMSVTCLECNERVLAVPYDEQTAFTPAASSEKA